ncbi:MAG: zinc-dependent metalloprotease [Ilumatobacteraceae bacterium]
MAAMMQGISQMLGPSMLGTGIRPMVGQLATRLRTIRPADRDRATRLLVVPATIDEFATEWSLGRDELRLWVCLQELAGHAVLNVPHVRAAMSSAVGQHVAGFRPDPAAISEKLGSLDLGDADAIATLQQTLGDPEVLLGAVQTPEQRAALPRLDALVSVVIGYVDHVVDQAASPGSRITRSRGRACGDGSDLAEDVFVEKLFGLTLGRAQVEQGRAFIARVRSVPTRPRCAGCSSEPMPCRPPTRSMRPSCVRPDFEVRRLIWADRPGSG